MIPSNQDSLFRLLKVLSLFGDCDLTYKGVSLTTSQSRLPIVVSETFFRKFTCVEGCSVCCTMTHTLDFLPSEPELQSETLRKIGFEPRRIDVGTFDSSRSIEVWSQLKVAKTGAPCPFLIMRRTTGNEVPGCSLWPFHPLECAAAVNMRITEHKGQVVRITKQPMARAWRYDPTPQCEFAYDENWRENIATNIALFRRYQVWASALSLIPSYTRLGGLIAALENLSKPERFVIL